jgi:hypothetical protein
MGQPPPPPPPPLMYNGRTNLHNTVRATCTTYTPYRYYNDLWELSLETMKWTSLGAGPAGNAGAGAPWPSPRSGCGLTAVGEALWVFGGYSKVRMGQAGRPE